MEEKIRHLSELIGKAGRISVLAHTHPDGDAIGSCLALTLCLRQLWGKDAAMILPDKVPSTLTFIAGAERILTDSEEPQAARERLASSDLVFLLDANAFTRTAGLEGGLRASTAQKVLIDHHLAPDEGAFSLVFSQTSVSSTCELLYFILKGLPEIGGAPRRIPAAAATALMTGMTTDTNNFANSVFPGTMRMASELIAAGVDRDGILRNLYNMYPERRIRLMGRLMGRELTITEDGVAYVVYGRGLREGYGMQDGETEGFVNIPLSIDRVRMSIFLTEDDGHYRVSVRSKKGTSSNLCAQEYFHGGGHEQAAGGKLRFTEEGGFGPDIPSKEDAAAYIERCTHEFFSGHKGGDR